MTESPLVGQFRAILQEAVEDPARLGGLVRAFLDLYDSVPSASYADLATGQTIDRLAYELRYYAPAQPPDDTLLGDQQALTLIRDALLTLR